MFTIRSLSDRQIADASIQYRIESVTGYVDFAILDGELCAHTWQCPKEGREFLQALEKFAEKHQLKLVIPNTYAPEYRFKSLDEAEEWLSGFKGTEKEGLVLHYKNGLRIKIKSEDYKRIHKILTGLSAKDIWATLKAGASLDPILELAPDELYQWIKDTEQELIIEKEAIFNHTKRVARDASKLSSRKEQAACVLKFPKIKGIVFKLLDGKTEEAEQAAWDMVEPSGEVMKKERKP